MNDKYHPDTIEIGFAECMIPMFKKTGTPCKYLFGSQFLTICHNNVNYETVVYYINTWWTEFKLDLRNEIYRRRAKQWFNATPETIEL